MKFKKLLVLSALMFSGISSVWAVDGNVWTKPAFPTDQLPKVTEFTQYAEGATVYLYNVKTQLFWTNGNNWGTRASLVFATGGDGNGATAGEAIKGIQVQFTSTDEAKAKGEGVVELKNDVKAAGNFLSAFADSWNGIWTDNNSNANRFWTVTASGDAYRIANVTTSPELCLGWYDENGDTRLYLLDPSNADNGVDWKMVAPEVYETYASQVTEEHLTIVKDWQSKFIVYKAAMSLKDVLDEAEAIQANVADQIAVYNNTASTLEELNAAITAAKAAVQARQKELEEQDLKNATAANPKSATAFITNPDFVSSPSEGWTAGSGSDNFAANGGKENAELYNKSKFDVYQKLEGLPNGVYALGVNAFYRAGTSVESYKHFVAKDEQSRYAKVYAFNGTDSLMSSIASPYEGAPTEQPETGGWAQDEAKQYFIPNNMVAAEYAMHTLGLYANKVFNVVSDGTLTIGVYKGQHIASDWAIFDDFSLTYYGNGADAYQLWSDEALKEFDTTAPAEGVLYTKSYLDAVAAAATGKTAATADEVKANIAAAEAAQADLDKNMSLWKEWSKLVDKASDTYKANKDAAIDDEIKFALLDYIEDDEDFECEATKIKKAMALDNAGLEAEMQKLQKLIDNFELAVKNVLKPGDDATKFLTNPAFDLAAGAEEGWTGWHNTTNSMPTTGGTDDNKTAEAWSAKSFDLYQEVANAPVGIYEISVQGFYRYGRDDAAWEAYNSKSVDYVKEGGAPVFVYLNDKKTPFKNIYDEELTDMEFFKEMAKQDEETGEYLKTAAGIYQWKDIPYSVQNAPADAPTHFYPNGMASAAVAFTKYYTQSATSLVAKQGDKLRLGVKGSTQQPNQTDCWVIWDNFKLTYRGKEAAYVKGVLEEALADAQNVLVDPSTGEEKYIGKDAYEKLIKAKADGEAALAGTDGEQMWDALVALVSLNGEVDASAAKFDSLKTALGAFEIAADNAKGADESERPLQSTIDAAYSVMAEAQEGMGAKSLTDADADRLMKSMKELTAALKIPAAYETASDEKPANATFLITNPDYAENTNDGWSGTAPKVSYHEAEVFNKNFDYYQDIENVKPGTYMLTLQGFYRAGSTVNDYKTLTEAPAENNNAVLYATTADGTSSKPLLRLGSEVVTLDQGSEIPGGWAAAKTDSLIVGEDTILTHHVVPNDMEQAEVAFNGEDAAYNYSGVSLIVKVGDDGKLRIGVKKETAIDQEWTLWTNWTLTYYGANSSKVPDVTGISAASAEKVVKTEFYSLNGAQVTKPSKGIAIMKQTMTDGSVKISKIIVK